MISKIKSKEEIMSVFKDGQTIAIGGQAGAYMPWDLIDMLAESKVKHLTIYSIDACDTGLGIGKLIDNGQVDKMVTSHIGTNPVASEKMLKGELQMELAPMGTFMERIRCGGAGLGAVLTKTGLGTDVEKGKQKITLHGEEYLVEEALHADVALTRCRKADPIGNLAYHGTGTASHPIIATCADISIVQCDLLCDMNELSIDEIKTSAFYIDMVYIGENYGPNHIQGPTSIKKLGGEFIYAK